MTTMAMIITITDYRVSLTAPALALTTSVPAFWILSVIFSSSSLENVTFGVTYTDNSIAT